MNDIAIENYVSDKSNSIDDELSLVLAAQRGDRDAFGVLYERHKDAVYWFVLRSVGSREDAEDIVQDAFCRAWKAMDRFHGQARFLTWIYRIAARVCADRARAAPLHGLKVSLDIADTIGRDDEHPGVTWQALEMALNELPLVWRQLVLLCDVQRFSSRVAAGILGCSAISARVRLFRAHEKLRKALANAEDL